jgi:protein-tyrosine phosphatase
VHTLCGEVDVSDPIGAPPHVYQQCADQIESQIERWIAQLDLENLVSPHDASGDGPT